MTNVRFKELFNTYQSDLMQFCYIYYQEEAKGQKCDRDTFYDLFPMWNMMHGGMGRTLTYLKQKHSYT